MKSTLLIMNGHFRPHLSAARPKVIAPTDRNISTNVMPHVMSALDLPKSFARAVTVSETVKKSNASLGNISSVFSTVYKHHSPSPTRKSNKKELPLAPIQLP